MALSKSELEGENLRAALMQIELRQRMMSKLPRFCGTKGIWFGSRLATEQCSSERCAEYKKKIIGRRCKKGVDLTGGMGVDTLFLAEMCDEMTYVERDFGLCEAARHNFGLMAGNVEVVNMEAEEWLEMCARDRETGHAPSLQDRYGFGFVDPARRGERGEKVFRIGDCTPDVRGLRGKLLERCERVIVKLSPMLDVKECIEELRPFMVVIVSVENECKEVIAVMDGRDGERDGAGSVCTVRAVELRKNGEEVVMDFRYSEEERSETGFAERIEEGMMIYEPWAAMMKSGAWNTMAERYGVRMVAGNSHLYVGEEGEFPGRGFRIVEVREFGKREAERMLKGKANVAVRNFPMSVAEVRKRFKCKEGGERYVFLTTDKNGKRLIIEGRRIEYK